MNFWSKHNLTGMPQQSNLSKHSFTDSELHLGVVVAHIQLFKCDIFHENECCYFPRWSRMTTTQWSAVLQGMLGLWFKSCIWNFLSMCEGWTGSFKISGRQRDNRFLPSVQLPLGIFTDVSPHCMSISPVGAQLFWMDLTELSCFQGSGSRMRFPPPPHQCFIHLLKLLTMGGWSSATMSDQIAEVMHRYDELRWVKAAITKRATIMHEPSK